MLLAPLRLLLKILAVLVLVVALYFGVTLVQVWLTGRQYDPRPAGAIVVMGTAEYDGVPSPDLQDRLNRALLLYHQGYSHLVMVTGGKRPGDLFTEGQAGVRYLEARGVPAADLAEVGGDDTWQNLSLAAPVLKARGATTVLIVTDPFHEHRSLAIATDQGLTPYPTPNPPGVISGVHTVPYYLRETLAVGVGRIIGYQHI